MNPEAVAARRLHPGRGINLVLSPVEDRPVNTANHQLLVQTRRLRRQRRVRNRLFGTPERPRLAVFRSSKHIYAQMVNDADRHDPGLGQHAGSGDQGPAKYGGNKAAATLVGRVVAERAKKAGIDKICFDRRSYKYHGRVAAGRGRPRGGFAVLTPSR